MSKLKTKVNNLLTLDDLVVRRGNFVLNIEKLYLQKGKIACVVGPNGSGKTTLLLSVLGLLPHQGLCKISDQIYDGSQIKTKAKIGFIPDDPELLFAELTAREQWAVTASVLGPLSNTSVDELAKRAEEVARGLSFDPPVKLARDYSHGMRKKMQIVSALIGLPSVLVVDELRNGLDPIAITQAETLIKNERDRGAAVLAATHDLWWAERFADYIYILDKGKIVAHGTVKELLQPGESSLEEVFYRVIGVSE